MSATAGAAVGWVTDPGENNEPEAMENDGEPMTVAVLLPWPDRIPEPGSAGQERERPLDRSCSFCLLLLPDSQSQQVPQRPWLTVQV